MALCLLWGLLVLCLHPVCSTLLPVELKEESWEAQHYVDKGEPTFFSLVSSESSKNQIMDF